MLPLSDKNFLMNELDVFCSYCVHYLLFTERERLEFLFYKSFNSDWLST